MDKDIIDIITTGTILILGFQFQSDKMQTLDISHNNICDDGAVAISEYLKVNTTLTNLNISNNSITSNGIIIRYAST